MTNAELIKALRCGTVKGDGKLNCSSCNYSHGDCCWTMIMLDAADALEAAEQRIAELEAQKPNRGEWIEKWRFKTDGTPFHKIGDMECSVCHGEMLGRFYSKYCPHCGALLRGEHDEQIH